MSITLPSDISLSSLPALQGLLERPSLPQALQDVAAQARQQGQPLALLTLDIDHFKDFCDRAEPEQSAEVLQQLAALLMRHKPGAAIAVHLGADEFALLLPGLDLPASSALAEALRADVAQAFASLDRPLTVTIGVAATPAGHRWQATELLALADARMTFAKRRLQPHHNLVWAGALPSDWYLRLGIAADGWPAL